MIYKIYNALDNMVTYSQNTLKNAYDVTPLAIIFSEANKTSHKTRTL
jgi:hypothetical protein